MARITDEGIKGTIGDVVFYTREGKKYVRSKPGKRKKKRNAPENPLNTIFGLVSTYGSGMVKSMKESFLFPLGLKSYNNARGWMRNLYAEHKDEVNWELSVKNSGMCQLNAEVDLRDFLRTDITVNDSGSRMITVVLPEINPKRDFKVPPRTMKVNVKLIVVTSPFRIAPYPYSFCTQQISFIYNNDPVPASSFELQATAGTGDIAIVAMALEYETSDSGNGSYNKDQKWLPGAIIAMGKLK
ncbi:MAG: hypothetical protein ABI402_03895 [Ferruginibacter sp.]